MDTVITGELGNVTVYIGSDKRPVRTGSESEKTYPQQLAFKFIPVHRTEINFKKITKEASVRLAF